MGVIMCLFLSGVLIICEGIQVLGPSAPLTVELGGSVMLPCYTETPIPVEELEVEWKRTDSESLVHLFQDEESQPVSQDQAYRGRASFFTEEIIHGNFSLLLTNLTVEDAGVYNCSVYSQQKTGQTSVEIKEVERLIVTGGHAVSASVSAEITLNCSVDSNIPPEMLEVSWRKVNPQIPVLIFQEGDFQTESTHDSYTDRTEFFSREEIQRGNFSLRLKDLRTDDKGLYICEVFSGELSANATVEVLQLGLSSMHIGILFVCILAFGCTVLLIYKEYTTLRSNDNSRVDLAVHCAFVFCPNISLFLAFILWGVSEGFFTEAATCSALNLLRNLFLFSVAPYLDTFQENIQRFIKQSTIMVEYAVITTFAYSGFVRNYWQAFQDIKNTDTLFPPGIFLITLLAVYIWIFISGYMVLFLQAMEQQQRQLRKYICLIQYCLIEGTHIGRRFLIFFLQVSALENVGITIVLVYLPVFSVTFCIAIFGIYQNHPGRSWICIAIFRIYQDLLGRSWILILMSLLIISEVLNASLSIYMHAAIPAHYKEHVGLTCVDAFLWVLTVMLLFELFDAYEVDPTATETQRTSGHVTVYMLGAVGLIFVNSIALATELILKSRNGERTVNDLRAIVIPAECVYALCCLTLRISAFWTKYREKLPDDLEDLRRLCCCKRAARDLPIQAHELQTLQSTGPVPAQEESRS